MAEEKKSDEPKEEKPKAPAKGETIRLVHTVKFNGELVCGATTYPVKDGVVEVAPWHVDHARQAGYRPEAVG
jgi:hypothetical protein